MQPEGKPVFEESQSMLQTWLVILLLVTTIGPGIAIFWGTMNENPEGSVAGIILFAVITGLVWFLLLGARLKTQIYSNGIAYRFWPFQRKLYFISWDDVEQCYVRKYKPLGEFGGWGMRIGGRNSRAYTAKGNVGFQLELHSGKKLLIGTSHPDALEKALKQVLQAKPKG